MGDRRGRRTSELWLRDRWFLGALTLAALIAAADALVRGETILIGLLVIAPLVASLRAGSVQTVGVAVVALILALGLGGVNGILGETDHIVRTLVVAMGAVLAVAVARLREEAEHNTAALALAEERKSAMVDAALDCVITMDERGRVVDFNPAAELAFGYSREEALGREMGG